MNQLVLLLLVGLLTSCTLISPLKNSKNRPMNEMHGFCDNYQMDLANEMKLWESKPIKLRFGSKDKSIQFIQLNQMTELELLPENEIKYIAEPAKKQNTKDILFGGHFKIDIGTSGKFKISASEKVWLDIIDLETEKSIDSDTFEMQTKCTSIFKVVTYTLDQSKQYALQISASKNKLVKVLVTEFKSNN